MFLFFIKAGFYKRKPRDIFKNDIFVLLSYSMCLDTNFTPNYINSN